MNHPSLITPLIVLAGAASAILLFFFKKDEEGRSPAAKVAAAGFLGAAFLVLAVRPDEKTVDFKGFFLVDNMACLAAFVVTLAGAVTVGIAAPYLRKAGRESAEFYAILLLGTVGMLVMVMTDHLATFFIGLETMSLSLYVLSASVRDRAVSVEAGLKYFLTGAFASGILLFGIALAYGATGTLALTKLAARTTDGNVLALAGLILMVVGFAFKVAAAPFHQWAPDVYEGAPTPVTGFMSAAVKVVTFVALIRVVQAFGALSSPLTTALSWLAALTMIVGNIGALAQKSVKRLLAYSSVSHAGYVLAAVAALASVPASDAGAASARGAILLYLVIYTLMNVGSFAVLGAVETSDAKGLTYDDLGGLKLRHPVFAGCMLVFMLSLAGVPPFGGFLAKWRIFEVLVDRFSDTNDHSWLVLVVVMAISSVIGLAYYLRVIMAMYMSPAPSVLPVYPTPAWSTGFAAVLCAALTLWLGFGPNALGIGAEGLLIFVRGASG